MSGSSSTQPYSDRARDAARDAHLLAMVGTIKSDGPRAHYDASSDRTLDAAHDRQALGLDASVCARTVHEWIEDNCGDEMADQFEHRFSGLPSER